MEGSLYLCGMGFSKVLWNRNRGPVGFSMNREGYILVLYKLAAEDYLCSPPSLCSLSREISFHLIHESKYT